MAVPKKKTPRYKKSIKKSIYRAKTKAPALVICPQCHQYKKPHLVCSFCGYYKGKEIIHIESPKERKKKKEQNKEKK